MNSLVGRLVKLFLVAALPAVVLFAVIVVLHARSNDAETLDQQRAQRAATAMTLVELQATQNATDIEGLAYRTEIASAVMDGDPRALRLLAIRYRQEYGFDYLLVLDRDGTVVGQAHPELPGGDDPPPVAIIDALRGVRTEGIHVHESGRLLAFGAAPILEPDPSFRRVGALVAGSWVDEDLAAIGDAIGAPLTIAGPGGLEPGDPRLAFFAGARDYAIRVGDTADDPSTLPLALAVTALALLSTAVGTALAWLLGRRMARPIKTLTTSVKRFAVGEALPVETDESSDELAELTKSFSAMQERILERQRELTVKNDELEALMAARERFVSSIAHELRTPLTTIVGYTELLASDESVSAEETAAWLNDLNHDAATLAFIVEDLLVMGRADIGGVAIRAEQVDLRAVATNTQRITSLSIDLRKSVEVREFSATAHADAHRTRQIIRNLLVNALRHGGNEVWIDGGSNHETAWVDVWDSGEGLQGISIEEIFSPFTASDRPGQTDQLGLGLFVASELAVRMGGSISYRREGGRTAFRLTLPSAEVTRRE